MKHILIASVILAATSISAGAADDKSEHVACLTQNMYFEARNQDPVGIIAVGYVVMNRVNDTKFPNDVCKVVRQGGELRRNRCQFSWWCDGKSDVIRNRKAYEQIEIYAKLILSGQIGDPSGGALWYHADYVSPNWRDDFEPTFKVGKHIFYKRPS